MDIHLVYGRICLMDYSMLYSWISWIINVYPLCVGRARGKELKLR